jgi:hypothetical protein
MTHFDGREPSSYLLDPKVNFVPELPLGDEDPLGPLGWSLCRGGLRAFSRSRPVSGVEDRHRGAAETADRHGSFTTDFI